ncbi:MAG: glycosyltransferase family 2 protein [Lachnospiraceae bacterium]|nr:glycosyltransferase family 2 protein [Lachnospiraceae bacterium]
MISVIVPVYNGERFIEKALNSVLCQTYADFEIIVVNDGSCDSAGVICKRLASSDHRIRYFQKENTGVSDTRNFALSQMKGEYFFFLDADDLLPDYALKCMVREIKREDCDAVFGNHAYSYGGKLLPRIPRIASGSYSWDDLKGRFLDDGTLTGILFGSGCGVLYSGRIIRKYGLKFHRDMRVNEDGFFNLEFLRHSSKIRVMAQPYVYIYNQWKNSAGRKPLEADARFDSSERVFEEYFDKNGLKDEFAAQMACRKVSVAFWNSIRIRDAQTSLVQSRRYLKDLFNGSGVQEGLRGMDYEHMSRYKRGICFLMRHRLYVAFYFLIRYAYPAAEKVIKR